MDLIADLDIIEVLTIHMGLTILTGHLTVRLLTVHLLQASVTRAKEKAFHSTTLSAALLVPGSECGVSIAKPS